MKFYERVISDFGGYEKCKDILNQPNIDLIMNAQGLRKHLLEYRRQHNIFEEGDWVVIPSRGNELFQVSRLLSRSEMQEMIHATPEEIAANKRVEIQ